MGKCDTKSEKLPKCEKGTLGSDKNTNEQMVTIKE